MKTRKIIPVSCALFLLCTLSQTMWATDTPPAPLPTEAQQSIKKGLLAVEQKDWNLATRYFEQARKAAPQAPEVLFNLGLSESMMPGRELRSIAWFKAYLSANPAAPNAQAVRDMIDKLEVKVEGTIGKLIRQSKQLAGQFPQERNKFDAYSQVAVEMARTGDISGAEQMASMISKEEGDIQKKIAFALAEAGDIDGAKDIALQRINNNYWSALAFQDIAIVQAKSGDTAGAWATLENITKAGCKQEGMIAIAEKLYEQGKKDEAYQTLTKAANLTTQSMTTNWQQTDKERKYAMIGGAQARIGDVGGALRTADLIPQTFDSTWIYDPKIDIYNSLVSSYENGELKSSVDFALMEEVASRMNGRYAHKNELLSLIRERKNWAMHENSGKQAEPSNLRKITADEARVDQIKKWTRLIDYHLNTPLFMDIQGYVQLLETQARPWDIFNGIITAVDDTAKTLKEIKQMESEK